MVGVSSALTACLCRAIRGAVRSARPLLVMERARVIGNAVGTSAIKARAKARHRVAKRGSCRGVLIRRFFAEVFSTSNSVGCPPRDFINTGGSKAVVSNGGVRR